MNTELRQAVVNRLRELEDDGRLTPDIVLLDAQDVKSPLHGYFEWNDDAAAHKYRIEQARALIRSVKVIFTTDSSIVKSVYYVRDPASAPNQQGYVAVPRLMNERDLALQAVHAEVERIKAAVERARGPASVLGLNNVLDALLDDVLQRAALFRAAA